MPLRRDGTMLKRVLIDQTIELLLQCTSHFGRSTRAGSIRQALDTLIGKALDPLSEGGIGKLKRIGDGLQTVAFDHFTDGLSTTEDPGLFRLFQHRI
jgi:hypothetical protein